MSRPFTGTSPGPNFREYHLLLDDRAAQVPSTSDLIVERMRKIGRQTLRSIRQIDRLQRIVDNEATHLPAKNMLGDLVSDNNRRFWRIFARPTRRVISVKRSRPPA